MRTHGRDLRVDFLRGGALLILTIDHLPGNRLRSVMPVAWGLADMAEVFLLLSGFVWGLRLQASSAVSQRASLLRGIKRPLRLYLAYLCTAAAIIAWVRYFRVTSYAALLPAHLLANPPPMVAIDLVLLQGRVTHLCVLLLYFWLSWLALLIAPLLRRWMLGVWLSSLGIYLTTHLWPTLQLPTNLQESTYYNPFAWQFLFLTGGVWGSAHARIATENHTPDGTVSCGQRLFRSRLLALAIVLQGTLLLLSASQAAQVVQFPLWLIGKLQLGLFRYLHAVSGVWILMELLPREWNAATDFADKAGWISKVLIQPLMLCGQQALTVYCGGALLVVALSNWSQASTSLATDLLLSLFACCGCFALACINHFLSRRRNQEEPRSFGKDFLPDQTRL